MKEKNENQTRFLPISEYQKRFFLEWALAPLESIYNVSLVNRIAGKLNKQALKQASEIVVKCNEVFYACYSEDGKRCYYRDFSIDDFFVELTFNSNQPIELQIREILDKPFDLTKDVLVKFYLMKSNNVDDDYYFIMSGHHIIADAIHAIQISIQIQKAYNQIVEEECVSLNILKTFTKAVEAEQNILTPEYKEKARKYWLDFIGEYPLNINLPYRSGVEVTNLDNYLADKTGEFTYFELSSSQTARLKAFARERRTTMFIVLSALYGLVISKYANQTKLLLSYPINTRPKGFNDITGCFVNNVPLKLDLNRVDNFSQLIDWLSEQRKEVRQFQGYSLTDIIKDQREFSDREIRSFFNVGFAQTSLNTTSLKLTGLDVCPVEIPWNAKIVNEIGLLYDEYSSEVIKFKFEFRKALFDKDLIQRFIASLKKSIDDVVTSEELALKNYSVLSHKEHDQIIYQWNNTHKTYPKDKTIYQLFQEQVDKNPNNIALVFEGNELTYKFLNEKSNQLARRIRKQYKEKTGLEFKPDIFIPLYLDRSIEMLIGIMAVLKSGGAYVPLDPAFPKERISYILEDTQAEIILCKRRVAEVVVNKLPLEKVLYIDLNEDIYDGEDASNLLVYNKHTDLAYVIYTSGTTGKPKGVMVEHNSVVNYVCNVGDVLLANIINVDLSTNYTFDLTVTTTICSLLLGKKIIIFSGKTSNADEYILHLINNKIEFIKGTPSFLVNLSLDLFANYRIKQAFIGGEKLESHHLTYISNYINNPVDEYGPTETTVGALQINKVIVGNKKGIGKPYFNYQTYILDTNSNPVPIGVIGELYIGGAGLARGYLSMPDLTSERFIQNPFATEADKAKGYTRLYKTGDLVRWLPDGNIEFIGRNDDQVKIRGFRIELNEIEYALAQISCVKQSCVMVQEREVEKGYSKYLVGYYVLEETGVAVTERDILDKLSLVLPEYMIPNALIKMDVFPLTTNGKLNKKVLPKPEISQLEDYVEPVTGLEKILCRLWKEVLGLQQVGVNDDFFRLGGDSILSIQLSNKIRQAGYGCQVKDIFECKTITKLADLLAKRKVELTIQSEQGILTGELGLLPIQEWFVDRVVSSEIVKPNHWNQSFLIKVPDLDLEKLTSALESLVNYHDILRVQYKKPNNSKNWKQFYNAQVDLPQLKILDVSSYSDIEIYEMLTNWQSVFDLERGPLFQLGYLYGYNDGSARIFFALHHMIVDAVSWRILAEDMKALYEGAFLPKKGSSYRQWVENVKKYPQEHSSEAAYWEEQIADRSVYPLEENQEEYCYEIVELDAECTKSLLLKALKAYNTQINDLLLTGLVYALKEINQNDIQNITLEGHGREDVDSTIDLSRAVGWFTTLFPTKLKVQKDLKHSIQSVKEYLRSIPNKGVGFGAFAVTPEVNFSYKNLPLVSFNYLGQFDVRGGDWQIVSESSGLSINPTNRNHNLIDINGMVSNGKLMFKVATKLGVDTTRRLCCSLTNHLINVIEHCVFAYEEEGINYTPSDFPSAVISQRLLNILQHKAKAVGNEILQIYPATSLQQGFIYHSLNQGEDDAYRVQLLYDYNEVLDIEKYIKAWAYCIAQYPLLRAAFNWEEDIIQIIYREGDLEYQVHDISHLPTLEEKDAAIKAIQIEDRKQGFDLTKPTLLRLHIIKQGESAFTILKSEHHCISDGWSVPLLLTSLHKYYQSLVEGEKVKIEEDTAYQKVQDYINRNKDIIGKYWEKTLLGVDMANDISSLLSTPLKINSYNQVECPLDVELNIEGDLYRKIRSFTQKEGITINVLVQFLWHKLLQIYSNSTQSIVGTTISGRELPIEGIVESVGLYINTLPLVVDWGNGKSIRVQLQEIQQKITEMNSHSFADLAKMQKNGERLFQSLFIFENYPMPKGGGNENAKITLRDTIEKVDYPLNIISYEYDDTLMVKLAYDGKYLTEKKANQHINSLQNILEQVLENPDKQHNQINILSPEEYHQIIYQWNDRNAEYPRGKVIYQLFQDQVEKTPTGIALVCGGQKLTYMELNEKSNQLARYIRIRYFEKTGVKLAPDTLIPICLDRSIDMVIGVMAVLKSGGAYVPIDPNYPWERIDYILKDTRADLILSQRVLAKSFESKFPPEKVLYVDLAEDLYKTEDESNLPLCNKSKDIAYVIYTSGTTGKPKGVMVEHLSLINYSCWASKMYVQDERVSFPLYTSISFDLTVTSIFTPLISGGSIFIYPDNENFLPLEDVIRDNKIHILKATPSHLKIFKENRILQGEGYLSKIKRFIIGGEALSTLLAEELHKIFDGQVEIYNEYGPTEATVGCMVYKNDIEKDNKQTVPIGVPISNAQIYILDKYLNPVPVGVTGEIYISGNCLARGYLFNPALTEEKFIENPFCKEGKMYKTGDLAKRLPDGNIEFIGRIDEQVKIRGYRIELGEIESQLLAYEKIKEVVVVANEGEGDKYLTAYYVSTHELDVSGLREFLLQRLPDYMVPSYYVKLNALPLTPNGKFDVKGLPFVAIKSGNDLVLPKTKGEILLVRIWSDVLGIKNVGITDNFFALGGDSIKSIQICSRVSGLGYELTIKDTLTYQTIQQLAVRLKGKRRTSSQEEVTGRVLLTPIQHWFLKGNIQNKGYFNQSVMLNFKNGLTRDVVFVIFNELQRHHDALRMVFNLQDTYIEQYNVSANMPVSIVEDDLTNEKYPEKVLLNLCSERQAGIDLENGPLMKLGLFHMNDGSRLLIVIHHLVVDGVSWRILFEDIERLYYQIRDSKPLSLPMKSDSFQCWANQLELYSKGEALLKSKKYWNNIIAKSQSIIIRDNPKGKNTIKSLKSELFYLSNEDTDKLLTKVHSAFNTQINDILLAALLLSIYKQYGSDSVTIDLEGHGREEIMKGGDVSRTIGWFTTIFPVLLEKHGDNLADLLTSVKETLRNIPNNGIDFLILKHIEGQLTLHNENSDKESRILFNYLGQFDSDIEKGLFTIAKNEKGNEISVNEKRDYDWEIIGMILGGRLLIELRYSKAQYNDKTINIFMDLYKENLKKLIEFCYAYGKNELTPSDLTYKKISIDELNELKKKIKIKDIYPLTPTQEGMLFHHLLNPNSSEYFEQFSLRLSNEIDEIVLEKSFNELIKRHDILRTIFLPTQFDRPLQVVLTENKMKFNCKDIRNEIEFNRNEIIQKYRNEDLDNKFDLNSKGELFRCILLKTMDDDYELILSFHHIIMDAWSIGILMKELFSIYNGYKNDRILISNKKNQFVNYIRWLGKQNIEGFKDHWKDYLKSIEGGSKLPFKHQSNESINKSNQFAYDKIILEIDESISGQLYKLRNEYKVTDFTILKVCWGLLLSKYTEMDDVVFGTVISGRNPEVEGVETMIGLFMNMIPIRINCQNDYTIKELLIKTNAEFTENMSYDYHYISEIQSVLKIKENLIDHYLVYENTPLTDEINSGGERIKKIDGFNISNIYSFAYTNYDFGISISPGVKISICFKYNTLVYCKEVVDAIAKHYNELLAQICNEPNHKISNIKISDSEALNFMENRPVDHRSKRLIPSSEENAKNNNVLDFWPELS